eukprot:CAMPEP_0185693668 /NCGR_PEP_ID=MMETSP1164-20130828/3389_1 /TAXON_ID=1104430 /ORGANISM="Chrysoreinhardia sp, Strain CCMP2950" /LENGTH=80 /DNA_ID=CAMNT_0028360471 /DNA_START=9 /DNA_END=248 /DNA_ORIENTATION=-
MPCWRAPYDLSRVGAAELLYDRVEEAGRVDARRRQGPYRVGQVLRTELAKAWLSCSRDRVEEPGRVDAHRRESPRRVGEV